MPDRYERVLAESTFDDVEKEWTHKCGTTLMAKRVSYSVHDGPFPLSGSGEVRVITVPYCPACEEAPLDHGIITTGRR